DHLDIMHVGMICGKIDNLLQQRIDVGLFKNRLGRTGIVEEILHYLLASLALPLDLVDIAVARVILAHFPFQIGGISEDDPEGVVYLMGYAGREHSKGCHLSLLGKGKMASL